MARFIVAPKLKKKTAAVAHWLRCCADELKGKDSIPVAVAAFQMEEKSGNTC